MNKYEKELNDIEVYRLHPYLKPFVGEKYDEYKVLHIGESHYINQTYDKEVYGIDSFKQWWEKPCDYIIKNLDCEGWINTRHVMSNYMSDKKGAYTIFNNFIKSFSKVALMRPISNISPEDKKLYDYVAFMNFFQIPSLYEGKKLWDSFYESAKKMGNRKIAYEQWDAAVAHSVEVIDKVIDILSPHAVVFTSISAGKAYCEANGKYSKDIRIIYTSHPAYPFTWNKPLKSLDGKSGKEVMEAGLESFFG